MPRYKLFLFGSPRLECEGQTVELRGRKALALLCYLAVSQEPQRRDLLATIFWSDHDQSTARANLRRELSQLNNMLGEGQLQIEREQVRLAPTANFWLDVAAFQKYLNECQSHSHSQQETCPECLPLLEAAVALYKGDFLNGFTLPASPEFDEWQFFQTESLRQALASALARLVRSYRTQQEFAQAIAFARRWLALDPLSEPVHRQLMELYALTDQRTAALRQYEECKRLLAAELGAVPEAETQALYAAIQTKRFPIETNQASSLTAKAPLVTPSTSLPGRLSLPPFLTQAAAPKVTPPIFVGRMRELTELTATLATARGGQGQILFVIGGAGRGKTALVQEFARQAQTADPDLLVVSGNCHAHTGIGDPYLPFRELLTLLMGDVEAKWAGGLVESTHAQRLWTAMPVTIPALIEQASDLIGTFVATPQLYTRATTFAPPDAAWFKRLATLAGTEQGVHLEERGLFAQYTALLKAIAVQRPLLLILEDLHWVDAASNGLLFHLSRAVSDSRILIVGTYRPDELVVGRGTERHPLASIIGELKRQHGDIWLDLGDLSPAEGRQFVEAYIDTQPNRLDQTFRAALFRHTQGHALFTAELLRAMQERGQLRQDEEGYWIIGDVIDWKTLPAKVEGVIEQRIGRLPADLQMLLTVASIEGEFFTAEVVAHVQHQETRALVQRLSHELDRQHRLVTAEALERLGEQRLAKYRFRHYLFQHYLYQRLDETERSYLHEAVGVALETLYGDRTDSIAVALARHFEQAGLIEKAIHYLEQAGKQAHHLSASQEAIQHFKQGLELLRELSDPLRRAQLELHLLMLLINPLQLMEGTGAPQIKTNLLRIRELCEQLGEVSMLGQIMTWQWGHHLDKGELEQCYQIANDLLKLDSNKLSVENSLLAYFALGITLHHMGDFSASTKYFHSVSTLYDPQLHYVVSLHFEVETHMSSLVYWATNLWILGYPNQALQYVNVALASAKEIRFPYSEIFVQNFGIVIHHLRREWQLIQPYVKTIRNLTAKHTIPLWLAHATLYEGWLLFKQGELEKGSTLMNQGFTHLQAAHQNLSQTYFATFLIEGYLALKQSQAGLDLVERMLTYADKSSERWCEAELHRLKGELLLIHGAPVVDAETCFQQAIDLARRQQAKSWELRATMSLCRLWQSQGKYQEAHDLLAAIYGWFTEGFDTLDLVEAKALLDNLTMRLSTLD